MHTHDMSASALEVGTKIVYNRDQVVTVRKVHKEGGQVGFMVEGDPKPYVVAAWTPFRVTPDTPGSDNRNVNGQCCAHLQR
jgi:hypothetical protein